MSSQEFQDVLQKHELQTRIRELGPWWHCIDLGQGIVTKQQSLMGEPVDNPRELWQRVQEITPVSFAGARVLDVGCNAGYCSFAAERLGAAHVVGVDVVPRHIAQAEFVRRVLNSKAEFVKASGYDIGPALGKFDITLLLGVIYHCRHPLLFLDRMRSLSEGIVVVESAAFHEENTKELVGLPAQPLWLVENPADGEEALVNWFVPSPGALKAMLRASGFGQILKEESFGGRILVVAR